MFFRAGTTTFRTKTQWEELSKRLTWPSFRLDTPTKTLLPLTAIPTTVDAQTLVLRTYFREISNTKRPPWRMERVMKREKQRECKICFFSPDRK